MFFIFIMEAPSINVSEATLHEYEDRHKVTTRSSDSDTLTRANNNRPPKNKKEWILKIQATSSAITLSTKGEVSQDDHNPDLNISSNECLHIGGTAMGTAKTPNYVTMLMYKILIKLGAINQNQ